MKIRAQIEAARDSEGFHRTTVPCTVLKLLRTPARPGCLNYTYKACVLRPAEMHVEAGNCWAPGTAVVDVDLALNPSWRPPAGFSARGVWLSDEGREFKPERG